MLHLRRLLPMLLVVISAAGASTASAKTVSFEVGDDFFSPSTKTVHKGNKLKFVWTGKDKHNVVASGAVSARSGFQKSGTFTFKAKSAGKITLICEVHDDMTGTVTVKK